MTEKEKGSLVRKVWPPGGFSSPFARVGASVSVYEAWITSLNPAGEKCQGPSFGQAGEKWQGASGRPLAKLSRGGYMEKVWGLPPPHITRDDAEADCSNTKFDCEVVTCRSRVICKKVASRSGTVASHPAQKRREAPFFAPGATSTFALCPDCAAL